MVLCQMCKAIPMPMFLNRSPTNWKSVFIHHPSFKSLESSAKEGCNVCSLLYNTVAQTRFEREYPCGERLQDPKDLEPQYTGSPENVASKDGHRPCFNVLRYREDPSEPFHSYLLYKIGRHGIGHKFDIEFSDNPRSSSFHPQSDLTFSLATSWINKCVETHVDCNIRYNPSFRPKRLIHVGRSGVSPRLIETEACQKEHARYLALSYCWGTAMPQSATTTTTTLHKRLSKLRIQSLPRTLCEAILVTRRLGVQYLWIDSLCIIQDSPEDWQEQSALMGSIFSHCFCMIAAAAGIDCEGGLFPSISELPILGASRQSSGELNSPLILIKPRYNDWDDLFSRNTLNQRGWTLQERELAPRILYFTKHTMLFECREARGAEKGSLQTGVVGSELTSKLNIDIDRSARRCLDPVFQNDIQSGLFDNILEKRYDTWRDMVQGYSCRHLSQPSDKFPALSGLASEFAYLLDDQYLAGLWRKDLLLGLCWRWSQNYSLPHHAGREKRVARYVTDYGPSWSWAKIPGPISYDLVQEFAVVSGARRQIRLIGPEDDWNEPEFIDIRLTPKGSDPNGTLISASIHMSGQILALGRSRFDNCIVNGESLKVTWDFLPQTPSKLYLFSLGKTRVGLVLVPTEERDKEYQRVGIATSTKWDWFRKLEFQQITLV